MFFGLSENSLLQLRFRRKHQSGFTLIELMITVGIIGILVGVSGTKYEKYQRKARQSEAKIALNAIYGLQRSFYTEYSAIIPAFDAIGYAPEGQRRFYSHNACVNDAWGGSVSGYSGPSAVAYYGAINNPYTVAGYASIANCMSPNFTCSGYGKDPQTFNMMAFGQLGEGIYRDVWQMTNQKVLSNCSPGI